MKGQAQVARKPARQCFEDSRLEIKQTLQMHKLGTAVLLGTMACVSIACAAGLLAAMMDKVDTSTVSEAPSMVVISLTGCLFCLHYLWRCYRTGLEDLRGLLGQLSQLDEFREALTAERNAFRKLQELADSHLIPDSGDPSGRMKKGPCKPKRGKSGARTQRIESRSADNVLRFENYKNM